MKNFISNFYLKQNAGRLASIALLTVADALLIANFNDICTLLCVTFRL